MPSTDEIAVALQQAILDSAMFSSIATDASGVIRIFNAGAERLLGYRPADVINKLTPADLSDPDELIARAAALSLEFGTTISPGLEAMVFKAARGIADVSAVTRIRADGVRISVMVSVTALRDPEDAIIGYLLVGTDHTVRQKAEAARPAIAAELAGIHGALSEAAIVAITDVTGKIEQVNDNFVRISKYSREELIGQDHRLVNSGLHSKEFIRDLWVTITNGRVWRKEIRNRAKDGSFYWVDTAIAPLLDEGGKPFKYIAVRFDITGRKQAEAEADRHRGQLARLVEASVAVTGASTLERAAEATVEAIAEIFGAAGRVVLTQDGREVCAGSAAPLASDAGGIHLVSPTNEHGIGGTLDVSHAARALEPSEHLAAAHLHLVTLASAERLRLLMAATEKARERQEIVAIVSHDLRSPLQTFAMGLDAIERNVDTAPAAKAIEGTVGRMKRSITVMTRLLEDLLDVSRIHDGALPLRVAPHALAPVIDELCAQHLPIAQKNDVHLTAEVEPDLRIVCDAERITQALGNMVSNALRHTKQGSVTLRARRLDADRARIEVTDTGVGMRQEVRERLFERLYQGDTSGRGGGLGLGLYIVQGIVDAHGGVVSVESEVGRGTTFRLDLPLAGPPPRQHVAVTGL